jgi:hypothetical protein
MILFPQEKLPELKRMLHNENVHMPEIWKFIKTVIPETRTGKWLFGHEDGHFIVKEGTP